MFKEVLNSVQIKILPVLKSFRGQFYLGGGTAIALQIGHRKSIDFDLFSNKKIQNETIKRQLRKNIKEVLVDNEEELTCIIKGVKVTFLYYPFEVEAEEDFEGIFKMPALLDLAAMKAYTIGRRNELKDYIDLYFLLKDFFSLKKVEFRAKKIFKNLFSEKLFRAQLVYFQDLDEKQKIDFMKKKIAVKEMEKFFKELIKKIF